jgi:non-ribosomal peptide synthase protein (TIGR01720 family)
VSFDLLRCSTDDPVVRAAFGAIPKADIVFRFGSEVGLPRSCSPFKRATRMDAVQIRDDVGLREAGTVLRPYVLEVECGITNGRLRILWKYSANLHDRSTVSAIADGFRETLRAIVGSCTAGGSSVLSPSDFPNANLSQVELDRLVHEVGGIAQA